MSYHVADILDWVGGDIVNLEHASSFADQLRIDEPKDLVDARKNHISFFFSLALKEQLAFAQPGILVTGKEFVVPLKAAGLPFWKTSVVIACADPYRALGICTEKFARSAPLSSVTHFERESAKTHPSAVIDPSAALGESNQVGAGVVIESGAKIGSGNVFYPGTYIGKNVVIGDDCVFFPKTTLYENVRIGDRVRLHAGVVIGADGFGYAPIREADQKLKGYQKIYHFASVQIGSDVEIGANSCVDRGTFSDTVIGNGVKIDNHVQVGHNCEVGEGSIICGKSGMAGSSKLGKFVTFGGGSVTSNKVEVGDRATVAGVTFLSKNVGAGETAVGYPQKSPRDFKRLQGILNRLLKERSTRKASQQRGSAGQERPHGRPSENHSRRPTV